jgi:hypothetical protein
MRFDRHVVEWHGEYYTIEPLKTLPRVTPLSPIWAVSRRGEFIGTLPYRQDETTKEFEVRCLSWVRDLLGPRYPSPATDGEGRRTAISLPRLAAPQPHDKSSTEQFDTRPSMMRRPNSQQPVMADSSVGYVRGPLKARKSLWRPIKRSRVQRPEPCIWNVRAVMVKPLYKTGFNCRAWVGDA